MRSWSKVRFDYPADKPGVCELSDSRYPKDFLNYLEVRFKVRIHASKRMAVINAYYVKRKENRRVYAEYRKKACFRLNGVDYHEWDVVKVTGRITSETSLPRIVDLYGMIGAAMNDCIKVWPNEKIMPTFSEVDYAALCFDGKLWFSKETIESIEMVENYYAG